MTRSSRADRIDWLECEAANLGARMCGQVVRAKQGARR
jgi:hypothetical protein